MHAIYFSEICSILKIKPVLQEKDMPVSWLLTDSRKLIDPGKTIFFAINSSFKNAHDFIPVLYEKGVRNFVTLAGEKLNPRLFPEANILAVTDVTDALQDIVSHHRQKFTFPVIGITGSNGKTIVKEWLYQLLHEEYNIIRSPRSYNSQVGVPLSVWQMDKQHNLGIFEAGISTVGEMQKLEKIISPSVGLITFVGDAHAEGFKSRKEKIREKLSLFTHSRLLIYGKDDVMLDEEVKRFVKETNPHLSLFTWGCEHDCDVKLIKLQLQDPGSLLQIEYGKDDIKLFIPFTDKASQHNAMACFCTLIHLGITVQDIVHKMKFLHHVEMRLELKEGIQNCSIINDSYSADVNSLSIALDFLGQQKMHKHHTVILSDFFQTSIDSGELYLFISKIIADRGIHRFIGIGPGFTDHKNLFAGLAQTGFFHTTEEFISAIPRLNFTDESILLKGSRAFQFEKISHALEKKNHETVLEINLQAARNNFSVYKGLLSTGVKVMAMVKAFGYGSGSYEIAALLQHAGADFLAVAYADEGVELHQAGIRLPIMVMNTEEKAFQNILNYDLQPELYSLRIMQAFATYLSSQGIQHYPVHIKIDSGMHRLGFEKEDMEALCNVLRGNSIFRVVSVFSHLAASDDKNYDEFTRQQAAVFQNMASQIEDEVGYKVLKHIANTSAIHRHPHLQLDMVRLGIGLYGINPDNQMQSRLVQVATLKTTIAQVKQVLKGETVGYGCKAIMDSDKQIATVRLGYADGYPRSLGNGKGGMIVNNRFCPVVGNVCMDMTMIDVTGVPAAEGDDVIVFGKELPVAKVAIQAGTIPYEILTNISQRVKRVYYEE